MAFTKIRPFNKTHVPYPPQLLMQSLQIRDWIQECIEKNIPLDLEVGCGVGLHPIQRSQNNPKRRLIAIERTSNKYNSFQRRLQNHPPIENLFPLHTHAASVFAHILPDKCLEHIFFFYPNPEIKNPAARWIRQPLMSEILRTLKPNGQILFTTNRETYFQEIIEWSPHWGLYSEVEIFNSDHPLMKPRTHFEKKYWNSGQTLYQVKLQSTTQ